MGNDEHVSVCEYMQRKFNYHCSKFPCANVISPLQHSLIMTLSHFVNQGEGLLVR